MHFSITSASEWSEAGSCILNPCTCLGGFVTRYEEWDGESLDKGPANYACPPYGKEVGRDDNICLANQDYPGSNVLYFEAFCGEESPDTTYFEPKIRMRAQHCNAISCWTEKHDLAWDGECVTMAGGYAFPLHRMCARVALPAGTIEGLAEDPGYTKGKHLNFEGATKDDEPVPTSDGGEMILEIPKLCLYRDPSFYSFDSTTIIPSADNGYTILPDVMDLDPFKQPIHKLQGVHPVIEAVTFLVDNGTTFSQGAFSLISSLFSFIEGGSGEEGGTTVGSVLADTFAFLGDVIAWAGSLITEYIREAGQINRIVSSDEYGCVNIPLGPFPPPFCDTIIPTSPIATLHNVCSTDENGDLLPSLEGRECVVSSDRNNYIHNTIRIGYDKFLPICENGENPAETDLCVSIENLDSFASAKALHLLTNKRDMIKHCSSASSGEPCVNSVITNACSSGNNSCADGFRIVYGTFLGSYSTPSPYFRDDLNDCPSDVSATCQKIWGVNVGEFIDIHLEFGEIQTDYDILPITTSFSITNTEGKQESFNASIVRVAEFNDEHSFTQDPNDVCVFQDDKLIGCKPRATKPKILIYECESGIIPGISCSSNYFNPKFIVSYKAPYKTGYGEDDIEYDVTSSAIEPLSVHSGSGALQSIINLAGNDLEAFVTDETFISKPFYGPNAPSPVSLYGTYQNDIPPISADGIVNENAVYIGGLEYINDKYYRGGKYTCLANNNHVRCPADPSICVLSNLINRDVVRCSLFIEKYRQHNGLSLCKPEQLSCTSVDSIDKIGGAGIIEIKHCSDGSKCYNSEVELCIASTLPEDRFIPSADLGNILSDSQYFDTVGESPYPGVPIPTVGVYDKDLYGIRDKTAVERGYCVEIPPGTCAAENNYSQDNGYAAWSEANSGEDSLGTCQEGWQPVGTLVRKCLPNAENQTFELEPLYFLEDDGSGNIQKIYTDVRCEPIP